MMNKRYFPILLMALTIILVACGGASQGGDGVADAQPADNNQAPPPSSGGNEGQPPPPDSGQPDASEEQSETNPEPEALIVQIVVDTGQTTCYNNSTTITCPAEGQPFYGQDGSFEVNPPSFVDNGDGTITDLNTGLMWQRDPGPKQSYTDAVAGADSFTLAGYDDWRLPSIKELYSLMNFNGTDPSGPNPANLIPFIDTNYFAFEYGDTSTGARVIDSQWATSNVYVDRVFGGVNCFFGVNFADGRIKCYPTQPRNQDGGYFAIYVRGSYYGDNDFVDNGDGTLTDRSSALMWTQNDSGQGLLWADALSYCENLTTAGYDDWHLPHVKQLQYTVDYTRSPSTTNSPAIDPLFNLTQITNEAGQPDWGFYWSGTTHLNSNGGVNQGAYVAFGRALGNMEEFGGWIDVHGAGAQRSDPKDGVPADRVNGHGPQGDAVRSYNYVLCVRQDTVFLNSDAVVGTTATVGVVPAEGDPPAGNVTGNINAGGGTPPDGGTGGDTGGSADGGGSQPSDGGGGVQSPDGSPPPTLSGPEGGTPPPPDGGGGQPPPPPGGSPP